MLSIMGERERTQKSMRMGMRFIATYVLPPSFKKTQSYLVIYMYNNIIQ